MKQQWVVVNQHRGRITRPSSNRALLILGGHGQIARGQEVLEQTKGKLDHLSCTMIRFSTFKGYRRSEEEDDDVFVCSPGPQTASPMGQGRPESPVYTNLQELKISQSSLPPQPSSSPLHTLGDWETHKDSTGRHFYFNRTSLERTWKPPRARDASSSGSSRSEPHGTGDLEPLSSEENCHSTYSSQSDSQYGSPLRGWSEELDEHGHTLYVCEYTNEKYNLSPPQPGDPPKSRSLDRKVPEPIVLTKWRHSAYVLDVSDKESATSPKLSSPDSDSCPSSPKPPTTPSEKCGVLNVTKITENGKKVRKNWTSSWTVLQGSSLLFAKGQGSGTSWKFGSNQSKPEFTVDLRGGSLKTRQGTELLIQSEIDSVINDWFRALVETISIHNSASMDCSDQKKTRVKLKKFLTRRPTLQAVRDKGYIKDQVFGCSLTSLCHRESSSVPEFVRMCIDHVENTGLNVDGLYRVSGNLAVIQKLRFAVNHDEKVNLQDSKWEDIHVTTGALKMFFRELPEPLFTYGSFNDFVNAIKCPDYKQRVHCIKDLIKQLPKPNHDTMQVLFKHLRKVIDHGEMNRMTTQSVAIVFGPTLLRPETETGNIAVHMVYQNQIVELILLEYENIFGR
ncbi:hypothetical protein JZ751_028749 [Albula glossodonta]|uniref:Rho GTPase activating protein 12 n=1 Tax=Albula glossodonta TaxID=121402 RepID=A0A8T2NM28_9TELE|nr:hypothetical protein JZ751_028749 [Albula glossodonta]